MDPYLDSYNFKTTDNRAEEKEDDELEQAALHGIILRLSFPSPAAFGAA